MGAQIRRLENNLYTIGTGIIALSAWSFIKVIMQTLIHLDQFINTDLSVLEKALAIGFVWILTAIICLLYTYIGFSARSEGKGKKKRIGYLVITVIAILLEVITLYYETALIFYDDWDFSLNSLITLLIDATSVVLMIEMTVSSIRIRMLKKRQPTQRSEKKEDTCES